MSSINILLLEDSPIDAELTMAYLTRGGIDYSVERVEGREEFIQALRRRRFDLILADYALPTFDGISALELAREHAPETPFIFVSGTLGEDIAIRSLQRGATDYVLKQKLDRLSPAVNRALRGREGAYRAVTQPARFAGKRKPFSPTGECHGAPHLDDQRTGSNHLL